MGLRGGPTFLTSSQVDVAGTWMLNSKDTVSTCYSCPFPFPSSIPLAQGCQASVATVGIPIRSVVFSQSQLHVGITWEALHARVTAGPKRPHLSVCPGPNFPLQGRQGPPSLGFSRKEYWSG